MGAFSASVMGKQIARTRLESRGAVVGLLARDGIGNRHTDPLLVGTLLNLVMDVAIEGMTIGGSLPDRTQGFRSVRGQHQALLLDEGARESNTLVVFPDGSDVGHWLEAGRRR